MNGKNIVLADDDFDDCMLFREALKEVYAEAKLEVAKDGQILMDLLHDLVSFPDVIFLDLNMPRKNGLECLEEIRHTDKLKNIPIVIFSTTAQQQSVNATYEKGANYYLQKPGSFPQLKDVIHKVLMMDWTGARAQPPLDSFIIHPDNP